MRRYVLLGIWGAVCCLETACPEEAGPEYEPIPLVAGAPQAGVYAGFLELPAGVPLGAYTARDVNLGLGGASATQPEDRRNSPWAHKFFPSIGYASGISLDVLWLSNNDRNLVLMTADLGVAFDGLVFEVEQELTAKTGIDLQGAVILATNHSHSAPAGFHGSMHFAPGFDRFDPRVARRLVDQFVAAAEQARADLSPVKIGFGVLEDFDPIGTDLVFRDRRGENNHLPDHLGNPTGPGFKDPRAHLLKVETLDGDLKAVGLHFGIHGTLFDSENHWAHWDAPGAVKHGVKAALGGLPVLFMQGFAGDISPVSRGPALAAADRLARIAAPKITAALAEVQTASDPIWLDSATITIPQSLDDVTVSRRGTSNFRYKKFAFDLDSNPSELPDNIVYDEQGKVIELIDEFPAPSGGGLCDPGTGTLLGTLGFGVRGPTVEPYQSCVLVDQFGSLLTELYEMNWRAIFESADDGPRNIEPGMTSTTLSFAKFDNVPVTRIAGEVPTTLDQAKLAMMMFPGEPCTLFGLRAEHYLLELGYDAAMVVGFAQDHEGYLMTVEDWLAGGYEPGINIWGPLQAEYLLESALPMAERGLEQNHIRIDDISIGRKTSLEPVGFEAFPETRHVTPEAGQQRLSPLPSEQWLVLPVGYPRDALDPLSPPAEVEAYTGVYSAAFEGGDVSIDSPRVELLHEQDGAFVPIDLGDGEPATHFGPGIFMSYTPSPAKPSDQWAPRRHFWVVSWQPVGEGVAADGWAMVPMGRYRFRIRGHAIRSEGADPEPYELELPPFEVVPTRIESAAVDAGYRLTYPATPVGTRMRAQEGDPTLATPLPEGMIVTARCADGDYVLLVGADGAAAGPVGTLPCELSDEMGNQGRLVDPMP